MTTTIVAYNRLLGLIGDVLSAILAPVRHLHRFRRQWRCPCSSLFTGRWRTRTQRFLAGRQVAVYSRCRQDFRHDLAAEPIPTGLGDFNESNQRQDW